MPTITIPQANPNDEITAASVNAGANALASVVNGQLDDANISQLSGSKISAATIPASRMTAGANPETRDGEMMSSFVASGCVWSAVSGLNAAMTAGVVYIGGVRVTVVARASFALTASKDIYIDVTNTGAIVPVEVANGATTGMTLAAGSLRLAKIVTNGSGIVSVTQGGSATASRLDPIGNPIYPRTASNLSNGVGFSTVGAGENTTSISYTDLATVGPTVNTLIGPSGSVIVIISAVGYQSASGNFNNLSFAASGTNTIAAGTYISTHKHGNDAETQLMGFFPVMGLNPGLTQFRLKYSVSSGTGNFGNRWLTVIPL